MPESRLNRREKSAVEAHDREALRGYFASLSTHFANDNWLGPTNRYKSDCIVNIKSDSEETVINQNDLSEYIAASAPLHCIDGWSFLGKAVGALSRGDFAAAIHLGYYAELRAAMALLASEGIGIFHDRHFVIDSSRNCYPIGTLPGNRTHGITTHKIIWLVLKHWAGIPETNNILGKVIRPGGVPISDWIEAFSPGFGNNYLGLQWVLDWGLDLKRLSKDHLARNKVSYRPWGLIGNISFNVSECSAFLCELWRMHQPLSISRFETLDRHILKRSLKAIVKPIRINRKISKADEQVFYETTVDEMLDQVGYRTMTKSAWRDFLLGANNTEGSALLSEAGGETELNEAGYHIQVLARATLLLRLATGACALLISETPFTRDDFEFWWGPLGVGRGLWEPNAPPEDFTEVWDNFGSTIDDVEDWVASNVNSPNSYAAWHDEQGDLIFKLSACELIGLWGLGL